MKVYLVTLLARSLVDDKIWQFIEIASADKKKVEEFLASKKTTEILTVNGEECFVERAGAEIDLV